MSVARSLLGASIALTMFAGTALAQKMVQTKVGDGGSPHVTTTWTVGGANISISYGRTPSFVRMRLLVGHGRFQPFNLTQL